MEIRLLCNDIILYCLHLSLVKEELDAWRGVSCIFLKLPCVSVDNCLVCVCVSLAFFPRDPLSVEEGWVYRLLLVHTCSLSPLRSLLGAWSKVSFLAGTDRLGGIFRQALAKVRKVFLLGLTS